MAYVKMYMAFSDTISPWVSQLPVLVCPNECWESPIADREFAMADIPVHVCRLVRRCSKNTVTCWQWAPTDTLMRYLNIYH